MKRNNLVVFLTLVWTSILLLFFSQKTFSSSDEIEKRVGTRAKDWQVADWIGSVPLTLSDLQGKVVLVRWWTAPHCPFCKNSAPALNEFYETYHEKGLEVIGFYHHKDLGEPTPEKVKKYAENLGFKFPVAIDYDWKTLKDWWLEESNPYWSSVTFLIDKGGIVRHIHPGGQYLKGDNDYAKMKEMIETLLAE